MDLESGAASLSMTDVDMTKTKSLGGHKMTFVGYITYLGVLASMVTACLAMAISQSAVVYALGCISLIVAPVAAIQRVILGNMETFREVHNALRQEVNHLQVDNNDMTMQVNSLKRQSERVKQIESGLNTIIASQGQSMETFVKTVKENGQIQIEIESLLLLDVTQSIIMTVMRADMDQDFQIDPEEMDALILRIKTLPGVEMVDEAQIRALLRQQGNGLDAVMAMVRNIHSQSQDKKLVQVNSRNLLMKL